MRFPKENEKVEEKLKTKASNQSVVKKIKHHNAQRTHLTKQYRHTLTTFCSGEGGKRGYLLLKQLVKTVVKIFLSQHECISTSCANLNM